MRVLMRDTTKMMVVRSFDKGAGFPDHHNAIIDVTLTFVHLNIFPPVMMLNFCRLFEYKEDLSNRNKCYQWTSV